MRKEYRNKLFCAKQIIRLAKKRRALAMLAIRTICGEDTEDIKIKKFKIL